MPKRTLENVLDDEQVGTPRQDNELPAPSGQETWLLYEDHGYKPKPLMDSGLPDVDHYPATSRAIPVTEDSVIYKESARINDVEAITGKRVREKSKDYSPKLVRVDRKRGYWTFRVGKWTVRVKASFPRSSTSFEKADLLFTCSCPFWRWQGPEHWGEEYDYQLGKPRGTATFPRVRDPEKQKGCCKHVYAVMQLLKGYRLPVWETRKR